MPLSRQINLSLSIGFFIIFLSTMWITLGNTHTYVNQQLASHAQDAATSLGLSMSPYIGEQTDIALVDVMMNAIFDSGYYRSFVLENMQGDVLVEKHNPAALDQVPDWFIQAFPIEPPVMQTEVSNGWNIVGILKIESHPGIAYRQLWQNAKYIFGILLSVYVCGLILVWLLVKIITKPIEAVVEQADQISETNFNTIKKIPRTPELKTFVHAINRMSGRLEKAFTQAAQRTEKYRVFAYEDGLTGLGNRRSFDLALNNILSDAEKKVSGFLFVLRLSSLDHVNKTLGAEQGDQYIVSVSQSVQDLMSKIQRESLDCSAYRICGAEVALVIESIALQEAIRYSEQLMQRLLEKDKPDLVNGVAYIGTCGFANGETRSDVLERADTALTKAMVSDQGWYVAKQQDLAHSLSAWRKQLTGIIEQAKVSFVSQPVYINSDNCLYEEWYARFQNEPGQESLPMANLIPASVRLDYVIDLDKLVIKQALECLTDSVRQIGLNISHSSLLNREFQVWLSSMQAFLECAEFITLEMPESVLAEKSDEFLNFVSFLKKIGCKITLDGFGSCLPLVDNIRNLHPNYLKIDGRYIRDIDTAPDNQLFVQSLINVAHGLNIEVIAPVVETLAEAECLKQLAADYMQGFYFATPESV